MITRRSFFIAGTCFAALTAGGLGLSKAHSGKLFLRPPGAVNEEEFIKRCIRCGQCIGACPHKAIVPQDMEVDFLTHGMPVMNFQRGICSLCKEDQYKDKKMRCIDICPTGALADIPREDVFIGMADIVKEFCIAWNWTGCVICRDKCPEKAITLDEKALKPVVDKSKCNGCGICEKECPSTVTRSMLNYGKGVVVSAALKSEHRP